MSILPDKLNQTCTILTATTVASHAAFVVAPEPTEPGTTVACRAVHTRRLVRGPNGEQLTATITLRLAPDVTIAEGDFVRITGVTYRVIDVSQSVDLLGGLMGYRVGLA